MRSLGKLRIKGLFQFLLVLGGIASVAYGVFLFNYAAGFLVTGVLLWILEWRLDDESGGR